MMREKLNGMLSERIAPVRFLIFGALFVAISVGAGLISGKALPGVLIGFDVAALVFFLSNLPLLSDDAEKMRATAEANDVNRLALLTISVVISAMVFFAVGTVIAGKHSLNWLWLLMAVITLAFAWCFANVVFALHYAHLYYLKGPEGEDQRGLEVPNTETPDYWDFLYFSFTVGMTFQTSDVDIMGKHLRRLVLGHSLAAFVFNMGILGFTVNALGGL